MRDLEEERGNKQIADESTKEQREGLLADMDAIITENLEALEALAKG